MKNKYVGVFLLIVGAALIVWGYDVYESAGSHLSRALSGDTPAEAWVGMVGGAICVAIGALKLK